MPHLRIDDRMRHGGRCVGGMAGAKPRRAAQHDRLCSSRRLQGRAPAAPAVRAGLPPAPAARAAAALLPPAHRAGLGGPACRGRGGGAGGAGVAGCGAVAAVRVAVGRGVSPPPRGAEGACSDGDTNEGARLRWPLCVFACKCGSGSIRLDPAGPGRLCVRPRSLGVAPPLPGPAAASMCAPLLAHTCRPVPFRPGPRGCRALRARSSPGPSRSYPARPGKDQTGNSPRLACVLASRVPPGAAAMRRLAADVADLGGRAAAALLSAGVSAPAPRRVELTGRRGLGAVPRAVTGDARVSGLGLAPLMPARGPLGRAPGPAPAIGTCRPETVRLGDLIRLGRGIAVTITVTIACFRPRRALKYCRPGWPGQSHESVSVG